MGNHLIDLTGQRFSRLIVLGRGEDFICIRKSGPRKGKLEKNVRWRCQCDCGKIILAESSSLKRKNFPTRSCGCFGDDILRDLHKNYDRHQTWTLKNNPHNQGKGE